MTVCPAIRLLQKDCQDCIATINDFDSLDKELKYQLQRLGICKGCPISINKASLFSDPIIFKMNNSQIALRKKDVEKITITIQEGN